ncbi:MAG TPA: hypothetical protein VKU94_06805 [Geobacterales bacterium]|nr:hypothetical protein [Geobacterales bacterium]
MAGNFFIKGIRKVFAEFERGVTIYVRYKVWLISDILATPFWVLLLLYGILLYAVNYVNNSSVITSLTWGIFLFVFVSNFLGIASSLVLSIQQGILENVIMTNSSIVSHLVGRVAISLIDTAVIGSLVLLLNTLLFSANIFIADPLFFVIYLFLAILFFLFFAGTYSFLIINVRSPWVANQALQFIIPFFSGAIPIQLFSKGFASVIVYSPFYYVIGPIIAAATGYYPIDRVLFLLLDILAVLIMGIISYRVQKIILRNALKKGKFSLF